MKITTSTLKRLIKEIMSEGDPIPGQVWPTDDPREADRARAEKEAEVAARDIARGQGRWGERWKGIRDSWALGGDETEEELRLQAVEMGIDPEVYLARYKKQSVQPMQSAASREEVEAGYTDPEDPLGVERDAEHARQFSRNESIRSKKITKSALKQLIKEELGSAMQENVDREEVEALTNDINTALQELASGDFESAHETL